MGEFWRMLAPRSLKRARRVAHPVRTVKHRVTPRPVRRATRQAWAVKHPLRATESNLGTNLRSRRRR